MSLRGHWHGRSARTGLDHVAGRDVHDERTVVEMADRELPATERGEQVDLDLGEQVVVLAAEALVRTLDDLDDDVAGRDAGRLVGLAVEGDRLARAHALVDGHLEHLLLADDLAAVARLALVLVVDDLARARALVARALQLLDHRAHLTQSEANTATGAAAARPDGALLAALAVALCADDVPGERELRELALVQVLERDVNPVDKVLGFSGSGVAPATAAAAEETAATAEQLREQVLGPIFSI
jgi:hypothetical protein